MNYRKLNGRLHQAKNTLRKWLKHQYKVDRKVKECRQRLSLINVQLQKHNKVNP